MKRFIGVGLLLCLMLFGCTGKPDTIHSSWNSVFYEIFVASYYDSDGDQVGDLNGVKEKITYLYDDLGVGSVWLMPIMPSPSYHKYDVTDYYGIDEDYGNLDDFDALVNELHARDMRLVIDLVLNHTSNQHPWFIAAKENMQNNDCDKANSYCDFYVFSTESQQNFHRGTMDYYYEGQFGDHMPDLNLDSPAVREEITNIVDFWLDRGVDGFRLDAVTYYYNGNTAKNTEFLEWLNTTAKTINPKTYLVGEAWTDESTILSLYESGIDSLFNFPLSQVDGKIVRSIRNGDGQSLSAAVAAYQHRMKTASSVSLDAPFVSNHDQGRSGAYFATNLAQQRLMASVYLLLPGNPFIYYGEEIGMLGSGVDPNKRLPMVWNSSDTTGQTLAPEGSDYADQNREGVIQQQKDSGSLWMHYQTLISLRNRYDLLVSGTVSSVPIDQREIFALSFTDSDETVLVLHNFSAESLVLSEDFSEYALVEVVRNGEGSASFKNGILEIGALTSIILTKK